jgi:hypothetical protein
MSVEHISHIESPPGEREGVHDNLVLSVMLDEPFPCTVAELGCELDNLGGTADCVASLVAAGLVHRLGEFVFPTRAARRAAYLQVGTG